MRWQDELLANMRAGTKDRQLIDSLNELVRPVHYDAHLFCITGALCQVVWFQKHSVISVQNLSESLFGAIKTSL